MRDRAATTSRVVFPVHLLLVEDNLDDAQDVMGKINTLGAVNYQISHVVRLEPALMELRKGSTDVVLLDLSLPDSEPGNTVTSTLEVCPAQTAIVVISGVDDEEVAALAVQQGAQDYLVKDYFDAFVLGRVIRYAIERQRLQRELRDKQEQELATLKALVPFCAYCGRVRDRATSEWMTADEYLELYAKVDATHGVCADCRAELVADLIEEDERLDRRVREFLGRVLRK